METKLKKHSYVWGGGECTVYAEDKALADAIMAKVMTELEQRPKVEYCKVANESVYIQIRS